jgi:hypothetical protein
MERDFPHIGDTAFPHLSNIDVWKYRNNFDYSRWDDNARIKLCAVNWDGDYRNVVNWETDTARDAYFDNLDGYKVDEPTMFQVQPDGTVKIPVPFNAATQCNYLVLDYPVMPTPADPVSYAAPARNRYLYYCEAVEELAPNTTLCHVQLDVWSTYINSVDVSGMMLARGHAPMSQITASSYLENPYAHQTMLTAPDVTFGTFARTPAVKSHVFNGDVLAVITMTAVSWGNWGSKSAGTWQVPAEPLYLDDTPSLLSFSVAPDKLAELLAAMKSQTPQAFQTIRAVWFAPAELVATGEPYTFAGVSVARVMARSWQSFEVPAWNKADFGYPSKCADMAKLYTYPYARIMAHTDAGDVELRIEETEGDISVAARLNLAGPFIAVDTYVHLGGASASLAFAALSSISMPWAGDALKTLRSLEIPSFAVYLDAGTVNDYATHFDRAQAETALQNAYTSATASAQTALTNGEASVDLSVANLATSVTAATTVLAESQDMETTILNNTIEVNNILTNNANLLTQTITDANNEVAAVSNMNNVNASVQSGQLALGMGAAQGLGQVASMDFAGALTTAASNFQYAFNQATSMQANTANVGIAITTREEITTATKQSNSVRNTEGNQLNLINTRRKQRAERTNLSTETTSQTTQNNRSAGVNKANMQRAYNTNVANAGRGRDTARSAISNQIKQAALGAPLEGGAFSNGSTASTRPLGWVFEVQTQDEGSIMAAASHFARYGYALGQYWDFTGWQLMRDFTYWQCDDVWITPRACTQGAASLIRSILIEGTTVWREPAIIGATDIWEN